MEALLLVDIQQDFLPGGALAVPAGNEVIAVANRLMPAFPLVVATKDWHPANHSSFASQYAGRHVGDIVRLAGGEQLLWPDHCVQGQPGAEFPAELDDQHIHRVVFKGTKRDVDSYSGFFDNGRRNATELNDVLRDARIETLYVMGLATDYCVLFTALDAIELGYTTHVIQDGCRAVDLRPGDGDRAFEKMENAGARLVCSTSL